MRKPTSRESLVVLGLDITDWPVQSQFIFCAMGVFVCYLLYAIAQEHIMLTWKQAGVHLGWFLTMVQCGFYSICTYIGRELNRAKEDNHILHGEHKRTAPLAAFALIGAMSVSTIGLSNTAIEYVSYPTQVAFKSSKPIPVMLAGVLILNKRYSWSQYFATIALCLGLILFTTGDMEMMHRVKDLSFQPSIGVFLLCIALIVDGVVGNIQQKTFAQYDNVSASEMIMKTKGVAALLALLICLFDGQLGVAFEFTARFPRSLWSVLAYSICGVFGEGFVMAIIKRFGALAAVITTSVRKAFTMVLSFLLFSRPFTSTYVLATGLVWLGVALHIYGDHTKKKTKFRVEEI
jgi:adenosine 3'-phospho 5'-phosphosulfate transporter B3